MAKFTGGDLRLKDGQRVTFGTDLDSNMSWDGISNELCLDTTISGVTPSQNYHLTTKQYVDLAVTSGTVASGTLPHNWLTNFDATDDHQQYVPTNASRGFTASVSGIDPAQPYELTTKNYVDVLVTTASSAIVIQIPSLTGYATELWTNNNFVDNGEMNTISGAIISHLTGSGIIDHGYLIGLGDDDHTQYILVNGIRAFTGTVSGIYPTADAHLATKYYVDQIAQGLDWQNSVLNIVPLASGIQVTGNRYISSTTSGTWTQDNIYEWNGTAWSETITQEGFATWVEYLDQLYVFSNSGWVPFGSTSTHNNLSGIYGDGPDYWHLTNTQKADLTGGGNASSQHLHDDRYYTEGEVDVISGSLNAKIPSLVGYATELWTNNNFIDNGEMLVISGAITSYLTSSGVIDHGYLIGLSDDDHLQYVPRNGSRGFTSTVSGIDPTQNYHLATKSYVDNSSGIYEHGRINVPNGASQVSVVFGAALSNNNYTVNATLQNVADSPPSIYAFIVSATISGGFTVTFMGDMDSANYYLNWSVIPD